MILFEDSMVCSSSVRTRTHLQYHFIIVEPFDASIGHGCCLKAYSRSLCMDLFSLFCFSYRFKLIVSLPDVIDVYCCVYIASVFMCWGQLLMWWDNSVRIDDSQPSRKSLHSASLASEASDYAQVSYAASNSPQLQKTVALKTRSE